MIARAAVVPVASGPGSLRPVAGGGLAPVTRRRGVVARDESAPCEVDAAQIVDLLHPDLELIADCGLRVETAGEITLPATRVGRIALKTSALD